MSGFADRLAPELTTLALCWRVVRHDGVALGFTTHDRALDIDGLRYAAAPGMVPSAITTTDGLDVDTMEIVGALTAAAITARDLEAGRYDGAGVDIVMVDWAAVDAGMLMLARGSIGAVERRLDGDGGSFVADVRGLTSGFDATLVETCSPDCRAELGDTRCRVDLAPLTLPSRIAMGSTRDSVVVTGVANLDLFANGRLRAIDGANAGIDRRICAIDAGRLVLFEAMPFDLATGTRIELRQGCDKRLATCATRFGNVINFRGEPHVPGTDMLTRFPGA